MLATADIERMSTLERLQAMELLWSAITQSPESVHSPSWHGDVLAQRRAKVDSGKGEFLTIDELKKKLSRRSS